MGTVAKSSITLVSISDAYSLSLTPNSCVIKADFDGSNPKLEHAYTIISAYCGDEKTPIEIDSSTIVKSNDNIEYQLIKVDSYRYRLSIISLPIDSFWSKCRVNWAFHIFYCTRKYYAGLDSRLGKQ